MLGGESHGLLLSELGLTDGVPWQHQLLDHGVHRTLQGEAVFLEEEKEGWYLTKDGNGFSGTGGVRGSGVWTKGRVGVTAYLAPRQMEVKIVIKRTRETTNLPWKQEGTEAVAGQRWGLTARESHSSPVGPLDTLFDLDNCVWYCTAMRKPSSPTSVMWFPGQRSRQGASQTTTLTGHP